MSGEPRRQPPPEEPVPEALLDFFRALARAAARADYRAATGRKE